MEDRLRVGRAEVIDAILNSRSSSLFLSRYQFMCGFLSYMFIASQFNYVIAPTVFLLPIYSTSQVSRSASTLSRFTKTRFIARYSTFSRKTPIYHPPLASFDCQAIKPEAEVPMSRLHATHALKFGRSQLLVSRALLHEEFELRCDISHGRLGA